MGEKRDISSEVRRTYTWPDGSKVTIERPFALIVSENGHRVEDCDGNGHYIPKGWIHIFWENKPGVPAIAF